MPDGGVQPENSLSAFSCSSPVIDGFGVTGQALNGNGRGSAQPNRRFDNDFGKNFALHLTRDLTSWFRLGAFGYFGRTTSESVQNETTMLGADATIAHGPFELNLQYLHRSDDRPTFEVPGSSTDVDGGFAELLVRPGDSSLRLNGSGMAILNPPWKLDEAIAPALPFLQKTLGEAGASTRLEWLQREGG